MLLLLLLPAVNWDMSRNRNELSDRKWFASLRPAKDDDVDDDVVVSPVADADDNDDMEGSGGKGSSVDRTVESDICGCHDWALPRAFGFFAGRMTRERGRRREYNQA